jgi:deoxyribodipyrimidine photo-lyase
MILYYYGTFQTPVSITKEEFKQIKWQDNKVSLQRWKDGMTGCPIVDAGMREMNSTGFMHNRLRMIVASFLIFFLKIDWREGMRYFSQKLVDIDWANNVGNWQWTAGVEKWSNDYYKVFSMESQIKRFDPECLYIKKWVPELSSVPPIDIINWEYSYVDYPKIQYPTPIISNNKESRKDGIQMYKDVIQNM